MKLLLDNTGLHRVLVGISASAGQKLSLGDALAILHFAEHIMFADGMAVSTFEPAQIQDISARAIERLTAEGCVLLPDKKSLLTAEDFSDDEYGHACDKAVPAIQDDLQLLDAQAIARAGGFADFSTKPLGVKSPAMEKWIVRSWSPDERRKLLEGALRDKAWGAFDYIVAGHDPIYCLVQQLARTTKSKKRRFTLAMLLDVIFRVAINGQLARFRGFTYAPAPQRAKVTHETDGLFRLALERMIQESAKGHARGIASGLIRKIVLSEELPLPIFALHFLERARTGSPLKALQAASLARDLPEVIALRKWLSKWETLYNLGSLDDRDRAMEEIDHHRDNLELDNQPQNLFSVVRPELSAGPDGSTSVSLDLSGFAAPVAALLGKLSRRRVLLSAVRREIVTDQELGARLCKILGRAIEVGK